MTEILIQKIRTATTKSTSGRSNLTYEIGRAPDTSIHLRIDKNSGKGQHSREWIPLNDIRKALEKIPVGSRVTSYHLETVFTGRSANNAPFLMAVLSAEKLLRQLKGTKRGHELLDSAEFDNRMAKLVPLGTKPKAVVRKTVSKKTQVKMRAAVKRKTATRKK